MAKLDGLETVLDFLQGLQPKIAAQIAKKVLALNVNPLPTDSKELTGMSPQASPLVWLSGFDAKVKERSPGL